MIPYVILMLAPLLLYQVAVLKTKTGIKEGWYISIGKDPKTLYNSMIVPAFFFLFFVLLSLRHESIGRDLMNYKYYFQSYAARDFGDLWSLDGDKLYIVLNWVVGQFTDSFQVFLTVVAAITLLPIAKLYSEESLAIAFGLIAYMYAREKKPLRFLLFALIAFGFHHTAFMILLYYPLYYLRLKKNQLWFVIPTIGAVFAFNKQIFGWASNVMASVMGERYEVEVQETGAYMMIILFALFAIAAYFFPDEEKVDAEMNGLRNFLLMAVALQCFAPVHTLAMRMNYYFIIFVPVVVPKILKYSKDNIKDVAKIARYVIVGFFVAYYLYTTYISCETGMSTLDTYPYVPFWGQ